MLFLLQYKPDCKLTIELLDTDSDVSEDPVEVEKWSEYVEKYVSDGDIISEELKDQLSKKPIFLPRFETILGCVETPSAHHLMPVFDNVLIFLEIFENGDNVQKLSMNNPTLKNRRLRG